MSVNYLYAQRTDRLASRLDGLIASLRAARKLGLHLRYYWPQPNYVSADYMVESIFDLSAMRTQSPDLELINGECPYTATLPALNQQKGWPILERRSINHDVYLYPEGDIRFKGESPADIEADKQALFKVIVTNAAVLDAERMFQDWASGPYSAVHIRRGDIRPRIQESIDRMIGNPDSLWSKRLVDWIGHFVQRVAPLSAYSKALKGRSDPILVFSDSDDVAEQFVTLLPCGRARLASAFSYPLSELQRAWLDILVMMKASQIIGTNSSFSDFAHHYGHNFFTDARAYATKRDMRELFEAWFSPALNTHPALRNLCHDTLEKALSRQYGIKLAKLVKHMFQLYRRLTTRP